MSDKISIVLPTRNRWKILNERAIPSVYAQTYKNWELIVVDESDIGQTYELWDGGKDRRYHIEKVYTYPKEDRLAEWKAGPARAINEGLKHVTGDWIARIDDDDVWYEDALESLLNFAKEGNYDFVSALWETEGRTVGMPYFNFHDDRGLILADMLGGVQTWLYKAKYKDIKADPYCWKRHWNSVNDLAWFEDFVTQPGHKPKVGFLPKIVTIITPRPGVSSIGSKGYLEGDRIC